LSAAFPGFQVREVTPAVVGNSGNVTLQIRGTDLTRITEVTLISSDNVFVPAVATFFGDDNHLLATFNLTGMPAGHFDVRVHSAAPYADFSETGQLIIRTQTDGDVTLADAVEVRAVSSNSATVNLLLPSVARFGQVIPFHVEVRNDGINDIPIPVILVRSANGTPLSTSSIVSATSPTQLQILPLGDEGPPTVLRPGTSLRIPLFGLALKEPASQIAVQTMPSDATAIPWDSYEATYRDDTPAAEWAVTWSNFKTMVGGTLASLHQVMRRAAEELATTRRAATFVSADEIIKLLLNYASAGETTVANFLSFPTGMDDPDPLSLLNPTSPQGEWGPVGTAPEPEPESDPPADNNRDTCASWRPRSSVVLAAMEAWAETAVIAAVSARNGTFASSLFVEYLQNSSPKYEAYPSSHVIVQGNPLHEGFKDSSVTLNVIQTVWDDAIREIKRRLTPGLWGTIPADKRLDINTMGSFESIPLESIFRPEQLDSALSPFSTQREGANPAIYYADALHYGGDGDTFSIPNAIAGGVGKTDPDESPQVSYGSDQFGDDRRKITGEIILRKTTSPDGQTVTVTAESLFRLFVKDTVDFCPGDLGEGLPVRAATVPLKSLEANGWAFDVGFETEFATKGLSAFVVRKNVTEPPTSCELNPGTQGGEGEASSCTDTGQTVRTVRSRDPNDITGPAGFGDQGWILPETLLPYKVRFENDPQQATAPALDVVVTNQLDSDMDWSTFELGSIGFGSLVVDVPPGLSSYSTSVESANLDGTPLQVDISAMLNADTGLVTVSFRSIDPATGLPPLDPLAGFLPPNDTTHRGEGFFTYFVFPKSGLPTGTRLENAASIVFDTNEPIVTNTALNTIDRGPPSSQVNALPATSVTPFVVTWTGTDDAGGSGIASYDIYVADNGGSFALFLDDTTNTSTSFAGIAGHTYQFYSIATDNLGFVEVPPAQPDAQTTAAAGPAWQNPRNRRDPTNDGNVVPQDVLVIVNELNLRRFSNPVTGQLGPRTAEAQFFYDVNGDNFATPNDVLVIINFLNAGGGEGEQAETASAQDTVTWWLGAWLAMSPSSVPTTSPRAPSRLPQMPSARDDVFAEWPAAASVPLSDGPTGGSIARIAKGLSSTRSLASGPSDTDADTSMTEDIRLRAPRRSRTSDTP
ncbi:MAG: dockerin type I domain-containing protein, partial [Pirellulaceae bacterium]